MNSIKSVYYLLCISVIMGLSSCTDLVETYKDFQGNGEISYAGKVDSIVFREGLNKVQMEGLLYYTRTVKDVVIDWEGGQKVVDIENYPKNEKLKVLIDNLEEGLYVFKVYTMDKDKNRSIITTLQTDVPGEKFLAAQNPVNYKANHTEWNTIEIEWGDILALSKVLLEYTDNEGHLQQLTVKPGDTRTIISRFKAGSRLKITTCVSPNENALEYIPLEPEYYDFPEKLFNPEMLERRFFKNLMMESDAKQGHGGAVANMWDGNNESVMHSADGVGVPSHLTIDLGAEHYLSQGKVIMRSIFIWCPYEFQVWGLPDVDDINNYEPIVKDELENKEAWEAESIAKGWVNLTDDGTSNYATRETNNRESIFKLDKTQKVRYIRYRALKVWQSEGDTGQTMEGNGAYFCTSELYLYKDI